MWRSTRLQRGFVHRTIAISDFDTAKQVTFDDDYMGRPDHSHYRNHLKGYRGRRTGLASTDGASWKMHRRFTLTTLRGFACHQSHSGFIGH